MNAIKADPDQRGRADHAGAHLSRCSATASPPRPRSRARASSALHRPRLAHLLAHALLLQSRPARALERERRRRRRTPPMPRDPRPRLHGSSATRSRAGRVRPAPSPPIARDADVWIDVARFRRSQRRPRRRAARRRPGGRRRPAARRGAGAARRADPRPIWPRRRLPWFDRALEIDPDNVAGPARAVDDLGDIGRDDRDARRHAPGSFAHRGHPIALLPAGDARRARAQLSSLPDRSTSAPRARWTTQPGRDAAGQRDRLSDRQCRAGDQAARPAGGDAAGQPQGAPAAGRFALARRRHPRHVEALRPIVDRPDADSYSLALMGKALEPQGDRAAAAHYLARAAQPQLRGLPALLAPPVDDKQFGQAAREAAARPGDAPTQIASDRAPCCRAARATRRWSAPAGCRRRIPARPMPTSWSATRSASRRFRRRGRGISQGRQSRFHRAGGAAADRGAAAAPARQAAARCWSCS